MNGSSLLSSRTALAGIVAFGVLGAGLVSMALFANAEVGPDITTTIHGAHGVVLSAPLGTAVHAKAVVATTTASTTPTGTVDFRLYSNASCTGTPTTQAGVPLVGGVAESATTTVGASGLSYIVRYNGDTDNAPSEDGCVAVIVTAPGTVLSTALSSSTVLVGTFVHDSATLSSSTASATGTVAYKVFTNSACTMGEQSAGVKTVSNGSIPDSDSIQFNTPGTYYWQAHYSGDQYNASATSTCTSEVLSVLSTSTPPGRIIVDKVTAPAGATKSFSFDTSGTGYADFTLTDAAAPNNQQLAPGTYRIKEIATPGWRLVGATCSRNGASSTPYAQNSTLVLGSNDTIACTFTNAQATSTGDGDDDDDDHDRGKHKGWVLGLPFGILKKILDGDFPGFDQEFFNQLLDDDGDDDDDEIEVKIEKVKEKKQKNESRQNRNRGQERDDD
ncbi:MAG: hypothetical protein AAB964_02575 [Patescibacteria group bacterium]